MSEFEISGVQYRSGRLDAFKQLHIARKLAPLVTRMSQPDAQQLQQEARTTLQLMGPALEGLAEMPEADVDFIVQRCCAVVQRKQGELWANVWNESARRLMFEDMDASTLMQIAFAVIQDNLGNFFSAPPLTSPPPSPQTSSPLGNSSNSPMAKAG